MGRRVVEVRVEPGRVVPVLLGTGVVLSVASWAGQLLQHGLHAHWPGLGVWVRCTDVDLGGNVPTWFCAVLLLVDAAVLWTAADDARARGDRWARHWRLLAVGFAVLSLDEVAGLHEEAVDPLQRLLGIEDGYLFFAWVIPAVPLLVMTALGFVPFLRALPRGTAPRFLLAGALSVGGAVGLELVRGQLWTTIGPDNLEYSAVAALRKGLEMLGPILLLAALGRQGFARAGAAPSPYAVAEVAPSPYPAASGGVSPYALRPDAEPSRAARRRGREDGA